MCKAASPTTYCPLRWMVGKFQEILDSSSGNWARMKSITDLRVLAFVGSCEAKYSSTDLNFWGFISFPLLGRCFIKRVLGPAKLRLYDEHLVAAPGSSSLNHFRD